MLRKVISLLLSAVVCTAATSTSLSSSFKNNDKSTFEIHRALQNNQHSFLNNGHRQTSRQLTSSSSSYTTLPSSYSSSSKSSKGSRYYYSTSKSSKKRSRRRHKKKYYSGSSYDGSRYTSSHGSRDDGMEIGGGGGKLYSTSSTLTTTSGSSSSEDHYYNKGFIYGSKSSSKKRRGKSSKSSTTSRSTRFTDSSSSSSFDDCLVGNTIAEVIREENGLDILETALDVAMLDDTLGSKRGPFTLFAPNREAFEALPDGALASLLEEDGLDDLRDILALHVVHGEIRAEDLSNNQILETFNGEELTVSINDGVVLLIGNVNNVTVVATNIDACNGVVHVIDGVLLPLFEETSSSSVDVTSSKTTHFTSDSFSKSSKRGRLRSFGTSKSGKSSKSGGSSSFTHFTDPSSSSSSFDDPCLEDDAVTIVDVVDDIVIDGVNVLSTLATTLDVAGLDDTLDNHGPFTLFGPSNEAFADLDPDTLASLLEDPEALRDVLGLHVVHGEIQADDLFDGQHLQTLNGDYIEVVIDDEGIISVGGAPLLQVSFDPCNGVVYIVDAVILSSVSKPTSTSSSGDMFHSIGSKSRKSGKSGFTSHGGFSSFSASGSFSKSSKGFLHRRLEEDDAHRRLASASGSKSSKRGKSKSSKRRGSDKRDRQQRQRARAKRKHEIAMGIRDEVTGELIQAQVDTPAPNNNREATLSPTITFTRPPMTGVRTASPTVLTTRAPDTPQPTENTVVTPVPQPTNGDENEDMFPTFAPAPFFIDPETPVPPPGSPITPFPTEPDSPNNMPPTPPTPSSGGNVMPPSSGGSKPYGEGYYDSVQSRDSYGSKDGSWYWSSSSSKSSKKSKGSKGSSGSSWSSSSSSSSDGGSWKWKSHSSSSKDTWKSSPDWKPGWNSWGSGSGSSNAQKRAEKRKEKQEKREEMNRNRTGGK